MVRGLRRVMLSGLVTVALLGLPVGVGAHATEVEVKIDFSTVGTGVFDPLYYRPSGIVFPSQHCGPTSCSDWFVGFVQGDEALVGSTQIGPIQARFTKSISALSLRVAPAFQGTVEYTLKAFSARGRLVGKQVVTVTQDSGDPETGPLGYFTIDLGRLGSPARSFTLASRVIRSSFGYTDIEYGVSDITFQRRAPR